jgi:hypothetical protein
MTERPSPAPAAATAPAAARAPQPPRPPAPRRGARGRAAAGAGPGWGWGGGRGRGGGGGRGEGGRAGGRRQRRCRGSVWCRPICCTQWCPGPRPGRTAARPQLRPVPPGLAAAATPAGWGCPPQSAGQGPGTVAEGVGRGRCTRRRRGARAARRGAARAAPAAFVRPPARRPPGAPPAAATRLLVVHKFREGHVLAQERPQLRHDLKGCQGWLGGGGVGGGTPKLAPVAVCRGRRAGASRRSALRVMGLPIPPAARRAGPRPGTKPHLHVLHIDDGQAVKEGRPVGAALGGGQWSVRVRAGHGGSRQLGGRGMGAAGSWAGGARARFRGLPRRPQALSGLALRTKAAPNPPDKQRHRAKAVRHFLAGGGIRPRRCHALLASSGGPRGASAAPARARPGPAPPPPCPRRRGRATAAGPAHAPSPASAGAGARVSVRRGRERRLMQGAAGRGAAGGGAAGARPARRTAARLSSRSPGPKHICRSCSCGPLAAAPAILALDRRPTLDHTRLVSSGIISYRHWLIKEPSVTPPPLQNLDPRPDTCAPPAGARSTSQSGREGPA